MSGAEETRDLALLEQIARNDRKAIALLYQRNHLRLYRFLLRFVKNEAQAEELVNETFIDVWRGAGKFEGALSGFFLDTIDRAQQGSFPAAQTI